MAEYVAIIECFSNGRYYVDDVISRGFVPLLIYREIVSDEPTEQEYLELRSEILPTFDQRSEIMYVPDDLDTIMKMLADRNIKCVVAGSEFGVGLADAISDKLGLPGNDPSTTINRTSKFNMHMSLRNAGLRYIRSDIVRSPEDIEKFWKENNIHSAILKPSIGTASNVQKCDSIEVAKEKFKKIRDNPNILDADSDPIIQEYIQGTEFIVNTISFNGRHKVTHIWSNKKILVGDKGISQNCATLMIGPFLGREQLVRYTYDMLDATGVRYGPAHSEFSIDADGPILIEINARIMGGFFTKDVLEEATGDHMTDIALDSYMEPEKIQNYMNETHRPSKEVMVKYVTVPHDVIGDPAPFLNLIKMLPGYRGCTYNDKGPKEFYKTVDLFSSPFAILFCHPDISVINKNYSIIRSCEKDCFDLIISPISKVPVTIKTDIEQLIGKLGSGKRYLLMKDGEHIDIIDGVLTVSNRSDTDLYDGGIFAVTENGPCEGYSSLKEFVRSIRSGGDIWMIPEAYENVPYGLTGIETILEILGISLELMDNEYSLGIYGMKR